MYFRAGEETGDVVDFVMNIFVKLDSDVYDKLT